MGLLSSVLKLFKKIFSKILKAIWSFIKKFWWLIAIVAFIWFAPAIGAWLYSMGAPMWLANGIMVIGETLTPYLSMLWTGATSVLSGVWSTFSAAPIGVQAALALGAIAALAPEETTAVLNDAADLAVAAVGAIAGATLGAVSHSPLVWVAVGLGLWWFLGSSSKDKEGEKTVKETSSVTS